MEADSAVITLCSMQSVHADVYRQMGGGKNLWGTKLSVAVEDHLPEVHCFGSEGEVSSRAKFVQKTYKPLSQPPRRPPIHFFFLLTAFECT